jgi:energy-coupling factor transporter ATP-binding protein EcfA2
VQDLNFLQANDLKEAMKYFGQDRLGLEGQELRFWFVERPLHPGEARERDRLKQALLDSTEPEKFLFVGHRGSGKSTELNKLSEDLRNQFQAVRFSVVDVTGRINNLEIEDLMLTIAIQVTKQCIEAKLAPRPLLDAPLEGIASIRQWWQNLLSGTRSLHLGIEFEGQIELDAILGKLQIGMKQSTLARDAMKEAIQRRMPELVAYLNQTIKIAEKNSGKRLLVIVEDVDKLDEQSAIDIFKNHTASLISPDVAMVYTFPIALRYSDHYANICKQFNIEFVLPNFLAHDKDGSKNPEHFKALKTIVLNRLKQHLIDADALDAIVSASGGIPNWLMRLMLNATNNARALGQEKISLADANAAISHLRRELRAPLNRNDLETLTKRHQDHELTNDDTERRLLYNSSLIEYVNGDQWCDAHPVLWSLLPSP